ncbi:hypothetical protein CBL_06107 [Carabus blaptoides fortunei]
MGNAGRTRAFGKQLGETAAHGGIRGQQIGTVVVSHRDTMNRAQYHSSVTLGNAEFTARALYEEHLFRSSVEGSVETVTGPSQGGPLPTFRRQRHTGFRNVITESEITRVREWTHSNQRPAAC